MARLRLPVRIAISHGATLLMTLALLLVTFVAFQTARDQTATVHENHIPSLDIGNRLLVRLERMENAEFMYFAPGHDRAAWMRRFDQAAEEFEAEFVRAEAVAISTQERTIYARMGHEYGAFRHIDHRMRTLLANGRVEDARSLNATESLDAAGRLREQAQAFYDFNLAESRRARDAEYAALWQAEWLALALVLLGATIAAVRWWRDTRDLVDPILALKAATDALGAGRSARVDHPAAHRTDELAALQQAFNRASAALETMTAQLNDANATLEAQVAERTQALQAANSRLERLLEEMQVVDRLKTNFIAVTSHELLTPVNFITGFGSILDDELMGPLTPGQRDAVAKILAGADRLTRMIRNTLEFTQLESGSLPITPEAIDYASVAADVAASFRPAAEAGLQQLEVAIADDLPVVWADPLRAGQVLHELLDNALKFAGEGRKVRLTITDAADGVATEVADTGVGIPADALPQLFKPFYQVDFSSTRQHGGLGLGLAIAHRLVARMGGTLLVQSRLGQGTTFRFTLPKARVTIEATRAAPQRT